MKKAALLLLISAITISTFSCKKAKGPIAQTSWFWANMDGNWETLYFSNGRNMNASGNKNGLGYTFKGTYSLSKSNISITFENGATINGVVSDEIMNFPPDIVYRKQ